MSNIRIDIASEFKDKGFKAAERRTTSLTRKFDNLTRTAKRTFIAIAGFQALKRSVMAFAEEDRAAQRLATSLRNLGLAYNTKAIEDYLEASEKATAINKDQLSPAIAQLISTTLDAQKSMTLLNLAMDISTGTGKDLGAVTAALSRAYNGNFTALGKLQTAYTAAELEALGFEKTVAALSDQFQGAAQKNATTYSGKIELLKIAFGDLAEEIGKGIVAFLTSLGSGNYDKGLQKLVNFGSAIGDVFRRAGVSIEYTKALLSTGFRIDEEEMRKLEEIRARFENPQAAANRMANNPAANRTFLADMRKQQALQKKIEADRKKAADLAAKKERERLQKEREALQLKRAGTIFDMENIQIVAALQGQIDGEQRLRLVALLALNNDIAEAAEKSAAAVMALNAPALANLGVIIKTGDTIESVIGKLINAQAKAALLDLGITNIPKAKNPFEAWDEIFKNIIFNLDAIANKIKNMPTVTSNTSTTTTTTPNGTTTTTTTPSGNTTTTITPPEPKYDIPNPIIPPAGVPGFPVNPGTTIGANQYPNSSYFAALNTSTPYVNSSYFAGMQYLAQQKAQAELDYQNALMRRYGGGMTAPVVNVTVQGSVIAQQDLTEIITDELYQYQKAGKSILFGSVEI